MTYRAPGIYYSHKIAYPPLSGRLEPGIPAILGYTEKAVSAEGGPLTLVPTRVNTWEAFIAAFGGAYPLQASVGYDPLGNVLHVSLGDRFFLWESVRLFFENGGRDIFIVAVGDYQSVPKPEDFELGMDALRTFELPTVLLMPDSVLLSAADLGRVQGYALNHCAVQQHRFAILDLKELHSVEATIDSFRTNLVAPRRDLGAAYYPWIRTGRALEIAPENISYHPIVYREPKEMGLGRREVMMAKPIDWANEIASNVVVGRSGKSEVTLTKDNFSPLPGHLTRLQKQLAAQQEKTLQQDLVNYLAFGRTVLLALSGMSLRGNAPEVLAAYVEKQRTTKAIRNAILTVVTNELNPDIAAAIDRKGLAEPDFRWLASGVLNWMDQWPADELGNSELQISKGKVVSLKEVNLADRLAETQPLMPSLPLPELAAKVSADKALSTAIATLAKGLEGLFALAVKGGKGDPQPDPVPEAVQAAAMRMLSGMTAWFPPSGAVAGLYATTDRERGIFKAPANASLKAVVDVGHRLTLPQQEDMNTEESGKAVNALLIRPGRGIVVNAARTCDANSREWRYVPVRRYFLAFEKAVRTLMMDYVFESNDAQLWENVRGMLSGYCHQQFRMGALAGSRAEEAFFVSVGQDETMTPQDILEGRLIVEIGLAVARPAEFIVLTFVHHMESDRAALQV